MPKIEVTSSSSDRQFYQLKTYNLDNEEQVKVTDTYLQNAYMPTMKRLGISPIGVFKPKLNDGDTSHKILLLIPFNSLDQVQEIEDALVADSEHQRLGSSYIDAAYDAPTFKRIESVLMRSFVDMPEMKPSPLRGNRSERIYELRSYESSTEAIYRNKVEMFNAGGEVTLFDRIGSNAVFYGEVISGPKMPNLMYMTTYENQESRDAHWKTFVDSPEWAALKVRPEYQNNVSLNEKTFLYPTSYSDY
ncbi:MAG: hypothetical protein ACI9FN_003613 [Saprospiraceae bacterium]|jgi:hypothetical protein